MVEKREHFTADATHHGKRDGLRGGHCNGGVEGVAALAQNVRARRSCERRSRANDASGGVNGAMRSVQYAAHYYSHLADDSRSGIICG